VLERVQFGAYRIPVHEPLGTAETRVQFFHAVPGGPRLDVLNVGTTNSTIVNAMGYVEDPSVVDHVPAGVYHYQVWTDYRTIFPGSPPDPSGPPDTMAIDMGNLTLQGRVIYSFFVIGSPSPGGPPILVLALAMPFGGGAPLAPPGPGGTVFKTPTPGPTPTITRTPTKGPTLTATATGSATRTPTKTTTPSVTLTDQTLEDPLEEPANTPGDPVTYTIILRFDQNVTTTVSYATADGSAVGSTTNTDGSGDYVKKSGTLSYTDDKEQTFTITIIHDTIDEVDEEFYVNLTSGSSTAKLTIPVKDNDAKPSVTFSAATPPNISESAGSSVGVNVQLTNPSAKNVKVTLAVTGGTATPGGTDFTLNNTELTFSPGQTSKVVPVTINNDSIDEGNETIVLTITGSTNSEIGSPSSTTITIVDNDGPSASISPTGAVNLSKAAADPTAITVSLSTTSVETVTVTVTLSGSAVYGVDYFTVDAAASNVITLTFLPGQTSKQIDLTVPNGATSGRILIFTITGVTNGTIAGSPNNSFTVNIID
jgi:hypothetical protein